VSSETWDGYVLELEDTFDANELDPTTWFPHYLPQWSSRAQSAARYTAGRGGLRLRVDSDQPPWCPDLDGELRVSSLQTGVRSGPLGSREGQHRFHPAAVVTEVQAEQRLYTPQYGVVELRARASADPHAMVALWMIGFEDAPEHSAEICVCEIFGHEVGPGRALVGMGVHPFGDPAITDEFEKVPVDLDVTEPHDYAVEWTSERVRFFVDGRLVKAVQQSPAYPMQLMLSLYAFPSTDPDQRWPKEFVVERVRGYRPVSGPAARPR
jgi:hypothetical protein